MAKLKKVFFVVILVALGLGCFELVSDLFLFGHRIYIHLGPGWSERERETLAVIEEQNRAVRSGPSDYLRGVLVPNQTNALGQTTVMSVNSKGFRGPPLGTNRIRIVCLGDSVTMGWAATDDTTTYPFQLSELLIEHDADVINAGMARWNSMDLLDLYVAKIMPLKPDYVVIMTGWNDLAFQMTRPRKQAVEEIQTVEPMSLGEITTRTLSLGRLLSGLADRLRPEPVDTDDLTLAEKRVIEESDAGANDIEWEEFDTYERILDVLVALMRSEQSEPILVVLPHFFSSDMTLQEKKLLVPHLARWPDVSCEGWKAMLDEMNRRIRKVGDSRDVLVVDCMDELCADDFVDMNHLTDEGNCILATCVAETIIPLLGQKDESHTTEQNDSAMVRMGGSE